jgi:hypothetical protein
MSDFFVDRLGHVTVAQGVARLDFLRVATIDPEKKEARFEPALRLAIPLEGLAEAIEMLSKLRDEIRKQQAAQANTKAVPQA